MNKTAIVILNWNGAEMLKKYLPSVLQHSRNEAEVYVADNASTDNSVQMRREHVPAVAVVEAAVWKGAALSIADKIKTCFA